jgi:GT2 family glycosyltransferase
MVPSSNGGADGEGRRSHGLAASVIIPVRNAGDVLPGVLIALDQQTIARDRFEVVIGDDGSTDGSTDRLQTADGSIRVVAGPPATSDAAPNRAAGTARGAVLAFCDADCRPEPTWLEAGLAALDRAELAAGAIHFLVPPRPTLWDLIDMDMFLDQERAVCEGGAVTADLFIRSELFYRLGSFEDSLPYGGDYDLVARAVAAGGRLLYAPDAVVWHPTRGRASAWFRKLWASQACHGKRVHATSGAVGARRALRLSTIIPAI